MEHAIDGLPAKVLNGRLRKLQQFGLIGKHVFAEILPHVEYQLTAFGTRFAAILDGIARLQNELSHRNNYLREKFYPRCNLF